MGKIMIDDDDDDILEEVTPQQNKEDQAKEIIKQGLNDAKEITSLLKQIEKKIDVFGEVEVIQELIILLEDIIPCLLLGDYNRLTSVVSETEKEITVLIAKQRRKEIFDKLVEKYI